MNYNKEVPLLKPLDNSTKLKPFKERYFTPSEQVGMPWLVKYPDQYYITHTNGLILFGLTATHPVHQNPSPVRRVVFNYQTGDKGSFEGKRKRNALFFKQGMKICDIELEDGTKHEVLCQIKAKAIDFNYVLESNPNLLKTDSGASGHLTVFMLNQQH